MKVGDVIINPSQEEMFSSGIRNPFYKMFVIDVGFFYSKLMKYDGSIEQFATKECKQWEVSHHVDIEEIIFGLENKLDNFVAQSCESSTVNHPHYYQNDGMETIDIIRALTKNLSGIEAFCIGNAVKYISRFKGKGGNEDIEKAVWYLQYLIGKNKD